MHRDQRIRRHYEPRLKMSREGYDIADWANSASQMIRFLVFAENVALDGLSLLDVGCGVGDLWDYLKRRGVTVQYMGVDIVPAIVAAAQERHADACFQCADIFAANPFPDGSFDVTFSSGTFNLNLGNNREFLARALERLFALARRCVVFNLLHDRTENQYGHCVYYNPDDVRAMLRPFPCDVTILDNYLPNDFTVICRRLQ